MKKVLLLISALFLSSGLLAFDQTGKTAIGVTGGRVFPVGDNKFNDEAEDGWAYGGLIRRHISPNWGVELAVTRQDYEKICSCTRSNIFDVLGFYRFSGGEDFSPVAGLGLGVVDNGAHQNLHLGGRARAGLEKAFTASVALGVYVDYQGVWKMPGASKGVTPSNIGTVVPKLEMTWTFGN